jgi:ATP-dependent DNA helicase RecG
MTHQELLIQLKDLQALEKESEWVEFKVNNGNQQEIGEYISALSNSACYHRQKWAYLVYGIEDGTHRLVGSSFQPSKEKIGNQELENWLATQLNPRIDFTIHEFAFEELNFVIFKIAATRDTPVRFRGKAFIRIGSYKKPMDEHPERERAIWNLENLHSFEKLAALGQVAENDVLDLLDYPGYFDLIDFRLPDNRKGILERLAHDRIIVKNGGSWDITNLGALLLAKDIDKFDHLSRKAFRVIFYEGNNRVKTLKEQVGKRGYAVGFAGLIRYLSDNLPSNEIIGTAFRKQVTLYPIIALRELVANAIIHQDFNVTGASPMIEVFANRIEITNPGKPIIDPLRFVDHSPESRNEVLARFMRRLNICEERGSGIDKVVFECEYNQLPAHETIVGDNYTRLILYSYKKLVDMDRQEKVRACYLHACLKYVSGEIMTNQSLRERFGIEEQNYSNASRIIADTISATLVKVYDEENKSRKFARYVPYWA